MKQYFAFFLLAALLAIGPAVANVDPRDDAELRRALLVAVQDPGSFTDRFEAEVWLFDMSQRLSRRMPDVHERLRFLKLVHYEANRVDLPPELVLAVIEVESAFDRWAISRAGAQGLMQVMPFWLVELNRPHDNLHNPETNLRMGCTILRHYLDRERGDLKRALAAYNGSLGRDEYPHLVFTALRERWYRQ